MQQTLVLLQSPLQFLSFQEAACSQDFGQCQLIFESCGNKQNERQLCQLINASGYQDAFTFLPRDNPEQQFSQHLQLVASLLQTHFDVIVLGHAHEWMRDYVVGHACAKVVILDDGMETLKLAKLIHSSGLNFDYQQFNNPRHTEQLPARKAAGLDKPITNPVSFHSFLQLPGVRSQQHCWQQLFSQFQPLAENAPTSSYFLGQGSWVKRGLLSAEDYLACVRDAQHQASGEFSYVPHRWDPLPLTQAIENCGIQRVSFRTPWELHLRQLASKLEVFTFNSTAALTSLFYPACQQVVCFDFRSKIIAEHADNYVTESINLSFDYLHSQSLQHRNLHVRECQS